MLTKNILQFLIAYSSFHCISSCTSHQYSSWGECHECNDICKTCSSSTECDLCNDGYYLVINTCMFCSNECNVCPSTCTKCSSYTNCSECTSGYYKSTPTTCSKCFGSCLTCQDSDINCINEIYFKYNTQCIDPDNQQLPTCDCQLPTKYLDTSTYQCLDCQSPCINCSSITSCDSCISTHILIDHTCIPCTKPCYECNIIKLKTNFIFSAIYFYI